MFSAIANYFFGPEKPNLNEADDVDYPMKEEEGWLVVNKPKSEENEENDDPDQENLSVTEDDILESIACLYTMKATQSQPPAKRPSYDCTQPFTIRTLKKFRRPVPFDPFVPPYVTCRKEKWHPADHNLPKPKETHTFSDLLPAPGYCLEVTDISGAILIIVTKAIDEYCAGQGPRTYTKKLEPAADVKKTAIRVKTKPYSSKWKYVNTDITCGCVNTSPVLISKTEILQQIKDLKPMQQVKDYKTKKCINKSQLNRQNRAYHYESSNKNKHRRDLWMRHSGANNNRKCC